ncbi:hypothetical protein [Geoglobus ahangari]
MGNFVQELIQVLIISAIVNALLLSFIIWLFAWSRPLFTHFMAKLRKQPVLLVFREDGRWGLVRVNLKHGFAQHKYYGDFIATPGSFLPLAGVPLAIAHSKIGFTLPPQYVKDVTLLKALKKKLSDIINFERKKDGPGVDVKDIKNVKVPAFQLTEEQKLLLKAAGAEEYEEQMDVAGVQMNVRGFLLNVKDTFEYIIFSLNPINLRARINARISEELQARQKTDAIRVGFAAFMVIMGIAFAIALLDIVMGGSGSGANVAQQVQNTVNSVVPISISQGPPP